MCYDDELSKLASPSNSGEEEERESLLKHVKCLLICIFIEIDLNKMYFNALTYIWSDLKKSTHCFIYRTYTEFLVIHRLFIPIFKTIRQIFTFYVYFIRKTQLMKQLTEAEIEPSGQALMRRATKVMNRRNVLDMAKRIQVCSFIVIWIILVLISVLWRALLST